MNIKTLDRQAFEQLRGMADFVAETVDDLDAQRSVFKSVLSRMTDHDLHHFDGKVTDGVIEQTSHSIPTRRYEPREATPGAGLVYFHGGGWVYGDLDTGDRFARSVARALQVTVISVHYRRAPEHQYPSALHDCAAVAEHARQEFDRWCAVAGDSAGGNLAVATALMADPGRGYDAQLLLYPCLDASMSGESYQAYADGYGLTRGSMVFFWAAYASGRARTDSLLSPLAAESVHGLPPTVLVSAGFDVLLDECQRFAQRLVAADVPVAYLPFPSLPHGFIDLVDRVDAAQQAVSQVLVATGCLLPPMIGSGRAPAVPMRGAS
jgi:acetyl esterase